MSKQPGSKRRPLSVRETSGKILIKNITKTCRLFYYVIPLLALASCSTAVVLRLRADSRALACMSSHTSGGSGSVSASGGSSKAREASAALVRVSIAQAFVVCASLSKLIVR